MKKLTAATTAIVYLLTATRAFAQTTIIIRPPDKGYTDIGRFISNVIEVAFIIAVIAVLAMIVWGAVEWIFSGGNKEGLANARNRILHALVGLAILAVAFALAQVAAQFLGFPNIFSFTIPSPR